MIFCTNLILYHQYESKNIRRIPLILIKLWSIVTPLLLLQEPPQSVEVKCSSEKQHFHHHVFSVQCSQNCLFLKQVECLCKRYSIIDQQIARHFVYHSECFSNVSFHATQIINPFFTLSVLANHDKGLLF